MQQLHSTYPEIADSDPLVQAYGDSWDLIKDKLKWLDLLLQFQMSRHNFTEQENTLKQFRGLVISKEEINRLLNFPKTAGADRENPEVEFLAKELLQLEELIRQKTARSLQNGIFLSLSYLVKVFQLTPFEENCIVLCLAPELDRKYEKIYAFLQDDITRKKPSVDLVFSLLLNSMEARVAARQYFNPNAPLLKYLLRFTENLSGEETSLISRFIKLDERIVKFLLGFYDIDEQLEPMVRLILPAEKPVAKIIPPDLAKIRLTDRLTYKQQVEAGKRVIFHYYGPYGTGKKLLAEIICGELKLSLIMIDLRTIYNNQISYQEILRIIEQESALQQAAIGIENFQSLPENQDKYQVELNSLFNGLRTFSLLTFLFSDRPWKPGGIINDFVYIEHEFAIPAEKLRQDFWENFSEPYQLRNDVNFTALAARFRFTPGQIKNSLVNAKYLAFQHLTENKSIAMEDLYKACQQQSNHHLGMFAQKVNPKYRLEDIILPANQKNQLQEICDQVKFRRVVYDDWGFGQKLALGKGLSALFSGPPGTGKTMAAEVIANELDLELYKIDLSQIVSKYIGETEKNLTQIFDEARTSNAILFFDEADALFGKRTEVKDAHDRYANIEVGYLLQKMEEYEGIVILATNLMKNIDGAFSRRIRFTIEFPFPEKAEREQIWSKAFPPQAPLAKDIDYEFLADRLKIVGGNIKNIALTAAFLAATTSPEIRMVHLILATKREYQKIGKSYIRTDFEPYFSLAEDN